MDVRAVAALCLAIPAMALAQLHPAVKGDEWHSITVQGRERSYLLHAPEKGSAKRALLLVFHGGGETPAMQRQISGFDSLSEREDFIVAYPEGVDHSWADGRGVTKADTQGIDDVAFARTIVAELSRMYGIDPQRVYATGVSNGGIFVNRLGCEAADVFAGIAPVIGTMATLFAPKCHPSRPVTVVGIQGIADPVVPFNGGIVGGSLEGMAAGGEVTGSAATEGFWRAVDHCSGGMTYLDFKNSVPDGTSVAGRASDSCDAGTTVIWYEIAGGGHRWPPNRSKELLERAIQKKLGVSSQNIDASAAIWGTFASHPRPQ